ncbi:ATP-binding protein [Pseudoalteromonas spongiae]|uniref:ATP-binding protein n=1 Tax=Pseudoalteromonas spongiae TaxID=298657 RepID=UPI000C2D3D26|nr:ATP-binding protein [Pseudoalteromonas spongiae]
MKNKPLEQVVLSQKTLVFVVVLVVCFLSLAIYVFEAQITSNTLRELNSSVSENSQLLKTTLQSSVRRSKANLRFLHATPPISGLPRAHFNEGIDPFDGTTFEQWKNRLETIFVGFMQNNPNITQLRVVEVSASGKELIRVDKNGSQIAPVKHYQLQNKSSEPYFLPSSQLEVNQIYTSLISLNKEYNEVTFPYQPTMRFSIPIYSENGKRYAFLIMNIDASQLLNDLKDNTLNYADLVITGPDGDVLFHPNESYLFSKDLGTDTNWNTLYKQPVKYDSLQLAESNLLNIQPAYNYTQKVQIRNGQERGFLNLSIIVDKSYINTQINERRYVTYGVLVAVVIFSTILIMFFHRNSLRNKILAETRREAEAIVDGAIDAIIGFDLDGNVSSLNLAAESLCKTTKGMSIGRHYSEISSLKDLPIAKYISDVSDKTKILRDDYSNDANDGRNYFAITVSPLFSENSKVIGISLIIRDISNEKLAEEKIKRLNYDLEAKVRERTKELATAKDFAVKNNKFKNAFISNITHQLITPLNGIIGPLNILKREPFSNDSMKLIEMIESSASNLNLYINDILDLSKIEAGKLELNYKAVPLKTLIENLIESLSVKVFSKGLEIYLDTTELQCGVVKTDPIRLTQIIDNLISNAVKFTETGGIEIKASTVASDDKNYKLIIEISDTGIGIDYKKKKDIFNRFNNGQSFSDANEEGAGLGLSICKQLCQRMGGDINCVSTRNVGSTFSFFISVENQDETKTPYIACFESENILIISDIEKTKESLRHLLNFEGACVQDSSGHDIHSNINKNYDYVFFDKESFDLIESEQILEEVSKSVKSDNIIILNRPGSPLSKNLVDLYSVVHKPITQSKLKVLVDGEVYRESVIQPSSSIEVTETVSQTILDKLFGSKVLIVDDNDINIEVVKDALSTLPIEIYIANNGVGAIAQLKQSGLNDEPICCVLMDCQMPELNGYETCEKVRAGEAGKEFTDIPIIAMTANAMKGEKEKCLLVGMNDYISKPLSSVQVLQKTIEWSLSNFNNEAKVNTTQVSELWDRDSALKRLLNKEDLLFKICKMFSVKALGRFRELCDAIMQKDQELSRQLAHSLKGMCGEISANGLRELFSEIEIKASQGNFECTNELEEIEESLPKLVHTLQEL